MKRELFKIPTDDTDDLLYISCINKILSIIAQENYYETVKIIKVKNWFDHKWLNYSGKEAVQFESGDLLKTNLALAAKWKDQITIPPFNPNRIISTTTYGMNRPVNYADLKPLHKYQISGQNLQNRLEFNSENILLSWYSSNSKVNLKGSLMIYELKDSFINTWYCQIEKNQTWKIGKTKNISKEILAEMLM